MGLRPTNNAGAGQKIARLSILSLLLSLCFHVFLLNAVAGIYELTS